MTAKHAEKKIRQEFTHVDHTTRCRIINMIYEVEEAAIKHGARNGLPKAAKCVTVAFPGMITVKPDNACPL